jgi:hypothetical protein
MKKPVKKKAIRKPRKKSAVLTAKNVRDLIRMQALYIDKLSDSVRGIRVEMDTLKNWLDRAVGPMIHRLALLGDWNLIKPEDGQRLMSIAGGEMTPVYIEWHLATFGVQATRERYQGRINAMPPYLRMKL